MAYSVSLARLFQKKTRISPKRKAQLLKAVFSSFVKTLKKP